MCRESGFTLIEILIVMAIGVILALGGFLGMSGYRDRKNLEFSLNEVAAVVRETRDRSITQENGYRWGMRLMSSSTGFDTYEVFKGATYANGTTTATYSFRRSVEFSEPSNDRYADLLFEPVSGKVDSRKVVSLVLKKGGSRAGDIIVNTAGLVTQRMEDDIVGYWHFDEGTGTSTYDASGNDNTGTVNDATWQSGSSCKAGECLSFDGAGDYIDVSSYSPVFTGDFTIDFWVKFNAYNNYQNPISTADDGNATNGFWLEFGSTRGFTLYNTGTSLALTDNVQDLTNLNTGQWYYITVVRSGSETNNLKLYVDNSLAGQNTYTETIGSAIQSLLIGKYSHNATTLWMNGLIDEPRIYNRAFTASEISAHYDDLK